MRELLEGRETLCRVGVEMSNCMLVTDLHMDIQSKAALPDDGKYKRSIYMDKKRRDFVIVVED
jgi:hypothetical protein